MRWSLVALFLSSLEISIELRTYLHFLLPGTVVQLGYFNFFSNPYFSFFSFFFLSCASHHFWNYFALMRSRSFHETKWLSFFLRPTPVAGWCLIPRGKPIRGRRFEMDFTCTKGRNEIGNKCLTVFTYQNWLDPSCARFIEWFPELAQGHVFMLLSHERSWDR